MSTDNTIKISLKESSNTKAFSTGNLVHQIEFDKTVKWIDEAVDKLEEQLSYFKRHNSFEVRHQDTISILGSRGSGKSSFLMSLLKNYDKSPKVAVLPIIDPTLIEDKGHVFLTIIACIKKLVEEKLTSKICEPQSFEASQHKGWKNSLQELAHGLPYTDCLHLNNSSWQDPEYIMDKGLRAVGSAKDLEHNFHKFVKESLSILDKKAFILPLDDIDVDFKKGWPVLETLRKYITTPQIISLISGDIDLFSKAIRKQQWANFGKALLKNESENLSKLNVYNNLVTEMEGQYLQKVMKPERRIHLRTLLEKLTTYKAVINIKTVVKDGKEDKKEVGVSIEEYYQDIFRRFGINNSYQANVYIEFLLNSPLRTQIQFLSIFENKTDDIEVFDPFLSDLYEMQIDVDLAKNSSLLLVVVILQLLLKEEMLSEAYQLQPTTTDLSLNKSILALGLLFSQKVKKHPFLIFDYLIKIGYIRNLLPSLGYQNTNTFESKLLPSLNGLCRHSEIFQDKELNKVMGSIQAYLSEYVGIADVKNERGQRISCDLSINKITKGTVSKLFMEANDNSLEKILLSLPITVASKELSSTSTYLYSIYTLLAVIRDIVICPIGQNINKRIFELSQICYYATPNFKQNTAGNINIDNDDIKEQRIHDINDELVDRLARLLIEWKQEFINQGIVVSPHMLGKISTRFYYAMSNANIAAKKVSEKAIKKVEKEENEALEYLEKSRRLFQETKKVAEKASAKFKDCFIKHQKLQFSVNQLTNELDSEEISIQKAESLLDDLYDKYNINKSFYDNKNLPRSILKEIEAAKSAVKKTENKHNEILNKSKVTNDSLHKSTETLQLSFIESEKQKENLKQCKQEFIQADEIYKELQALDNRIIAYRDSYKQYMHLSIVIFCNSVLVEDVRENGADMGNVNNNNPRTSNNVFIENLKSIYNTLKKAEEPMNLKFSQWLLSCPLLLVYLNKGFLETRLII